MKKVGLSVVVLLAFGATQVVRADLTYTPRDQIAGSFADRGDLPASLAVGSHAGPVVKGLASAYSADWQSFGPLGVNALSVAINGSGPHLLGLPKSDRTIMELPPAPSSTALFLSAMVSLGAWQLVRSGRDLHLGAMPDWYHTGGQVQVGHSTAFDLDFTNSPLCCFEQPTGEPPSFYHLQRDLDARCQPQRFLTLADPRGPPAQTV